MTKPLGLQGEIAMQTPSKTPSNMVASGSIGSGAAQQTAMSHGGIHGVPMPEWKVREGRGRDHALWEDSLKDLLPKLQLKWEQIYEEPPALPTGSALTVEQSGMLYGKVPSRNTRTRGLRSSRQCVRRSF